ncbi:hypothetical protein RND71_023258 [Anisodus tanguticus]|uniref:Uncharacterized protein n=1 Tax=Anisodus tanguticus TaxID=243964 RepID=A0AAE1RV85_9SOLA|nr:hypothetical protein RND71_023258 [Anisodus tanguticus]
MVGWTKFYAQNSKKGSNHIFRQKDLSYLTKNTEKFDLEDCPQDCVRRCEKVYPANAILKKVTSVIIAGEVLAEDVMVVIVIFFSRVLSAATVVKERLKDRVTQLDGKVDHLDGQV